MQSVWLRARIAAFRKSGKVTIGREYQAFLIPGKAY